MFPKASGFLRLTVPATMYRLFAILVFFGCFECNDATLGQSVSENEGDVRPLEGRTPPPEGFVQEGLEVVHPEFVEPDIPDEPIAHNDPRIKAIDSERSEPPDFDIHSLLRAPYTIYRRDDDSVAYLPGDGDQFGWLSFASSNYLKSNQKYGPTANFNIHLLSGPNSVALPPRLYDFELGFQSRRSLSDLFSYDCSTMVGVYSDFEDSARDGVRFPSHAVGMFHPGPRADWVFGVDYLGRDDIKILPVFGLCWHDPARPSLRYEMIFPRPRVDLVLSKQTRLYSAGLLGGGTWDIEFPNNGNDV